MSNLRTCWYLYLLNSYNALRLKIVFQFIVHWLVGVKIYFESNLLSRKVTFQFLFNSNIAWMSHNLQMGRKTYFFLRRRKSKLATRQRAKKSITKKSINQTTTKNPIHKEKHLTTKQQTANNCKTTKIIEKKTPLKILCNQPSTKPEPILMVLVHCAVFRTF